MRSLPLDAQPLGRVITTSVPSSVVLFAAPTRQLHLESEN